MRLDGCDCALEELRGVGFVDEGHQYAHDGDDDGCEVERPAPVLHVRYGFPPQLCDGAIYIPVERGSNIARIDRPENKTQIRDQSPSKVRPHATFSLEQVFDAKRGSHGRDRRDDASDETAGEDTSNV